MAAENRASLPSQIKNRGILAVVVLAGSCAIALAIFGRPLHAFLVVFLLGAGIEGWIWTDQRGWKGSRRFMALIGFFAWLPLGILLGIAFLFGLTALFRIAETTLFASLVFGAPFAAVAALVDQMRIRRRNIAQGESVRTNAPAKAREVKSP